MTEKKRSTVSPCSHRLKKSRSTASTNRYASGVLYLIESKIRNRAKYSTQLLGISKYSLEHMMPKKWRNYWPLMVYLPMPKQETGRSRHSAT